MNRLIAASVILLTGCTTSNEQYYAAAQRVAEAQAQAQSARYQALASMAQSGDQTTRTAAVMALALARDEQVHVQPMADPTLQWAQVLVGPLAGIATTYLAHDLQRDLSKQNTRVNLAQISASTESNASRNAMLIDVVDSITSGNGAGSQLMYDLSVAGYDAITQTTNTGYTTVAQTTATGYATIESIHDRGLGSVDATVTQSLGAVVDTSVLSYDFSKFCVENCLPTQYTTITIPNALATGDIVVGGF